MSVCVAVVVVTFWSMLVRRLMAW